MGILDVLSTLGDVQYIGRIPLVHVGDIMIHVGEYHEDTRDDFSTLEFSI